MFIGMLLNISFFVLWGYFAFSFLEGGYGIVSATLLSFLIIFFIFFILGVILGLVARYLGFKDKLDAQFNPVTNNKINSQSEIGKLIQLNFAVTQTSEEVACVFKDKHFPKWIKIANYPDALFFKEAIHTDKSGIYLHYGDLKPNHIILPPGALYGPEETV